MATTFPTVANQAWTTISADATAVATSISVTSASALGVSGIGSPDYAYATIITAGTAWKKPSTTAETFEIVKITAESGGTLTVDRGQDGTSAFALTEGDIIALRPCAANFNDITTALTGGASGGDLAFDDCTLYGDLSLGTGGFMAGATWTHWADVDSGKIFPASTSACGGPTVRTFATNRTEMKSLDFDASTIEAAYTNVMLPSWYDGRAIKVRYLWSTASGTPGNAVVWLINAMGHTDDSSMALTTGQTSATTTDTLLASSDLHITDEMSLIPGNATTGRHLCSFYIRRNASTGADTVTVDALLLGAWFYF